MLLFFEEEELELLDYLDCDLLTLLEFEIELSYSLLFAFSYYCSCSSLIESSSRDFAKPLWLLKVGEFMIDKALCNYFGLFNAISKKLGIFLSGSIEIGF